MCNFKFGKYPISKWIRLFLCWKQILHMYLIVKDKHLQIFQLFAQSAKVTFLNLFCVDQSFTPYHTVAVSPKESSTKLLSMTASWGESTHREWLLMVVWYKVRQSTVDPSLVVLSSDTGVTTVVSGVNSIQ